MPKGSARDRFGDPLSAHIPRTKNGNDMQFASKRSHYRPLFTCKRSRESLKVVWTYIPKRQFWAILTPFFAHNSRTRFFPDSKLGTRIGDHKSPFQSENRPKLMKIFRDTPEKLRKTPFLTPFGPISRPRDFFSKIRFCQFVHFIKH